MESTKNGHNMNYNRQESNLAELDSENATCRNELKDEDPVGTCIVEILNSGSIPGFPSPWQPYNERDYRYSSSAGLNSTKKKGRIKIFPLISANNCKKFYSVIQYFISWLMSFINQRTYDRSGNPMTKGPTLLSFKKPIVHTSIVLICCVFALSLAIKFIVELFLYIFFFMGSFALSLIIDFDDLVQMCPPVITQLWKCFQRAIIFVDDYIFFARELHGRKWTADTLSSSLANDITRNDNSNSKCGKYQPFDQEQVECKLKEKRDKGDILQKTFDHLNAIIFCSSICPNVDGTKKAKRKSGKLAKRRKRFSMNNKGSSTNDLRGSGIISRPTLQNKQASTNSLLRGKENKEKNLKDDMPHDDLFFPRFASYDSTSQGKDDTSSDEHCHDFTPRIVQSYSIDESLKNVDPNGNFSNFREFVEVVNPPTKTITNVSSPRRRKAALINRVKFYDDTSLSQISYQSDMSPKKSTTSNVIFEVDSLSRMDEINREYFDYDDYTVQSYDDVQSELSSHSKLNVNDSSRDAKWLGFGAKLGLTLMKSEHIQNVIKNSTESYGFPDSSIQSDKNEDQQVIHQNSLETPKSSNISQLNCINEKSNDCTTNIEIGINNRAFNSPRRPVHSMWTSPGAAMYPINKSTQNSSLSDFDEVSNYSGSNSMIAYPKFSSMYDLKPKKNVDFSSPASNSKQVEAIFFQSIGEKNVSVDIDKLNQTRSGVTRVCSDNNRLYDGDAIELIPKYLISGNSNIPNEDKIGTSQSLFKTRNLPVNLSNRREKCRKILDSGIKIVLPIYPYHTSFFDEKQLSRIQTKSHYQMCTVVTSKRIYVDTDSNQSKNISTETNERSLIMPEKANCLSITAILDKAFLRNGRFVQMTVRILDNVRGYQMPRYSKFPIGSCIATSFGIGVLVGWRVEDDCHVVRSLWQKRGSGTALAYLQRSALHQKMEAAIGFKVDTNLGYGTIVGYVNGGSKFCDGKYLLCLKRNGGARSKFLDITRSDIVYCEGAQFIPILEHIKEAAKYQMQLDTYESILLQRALENEQIFLDKALRFFSDGFEILFHSFIKAVEEDQYFDEGLKNVLATVISFLEDLDFGGGKINKDIIENISKKPEKNDKEDIIPVHIDKKDCRNSLEEKEKDDNNQLFWIDNLFGGFFSKKRNTDGDSHDSFREIEDQCDDSYSPDTYNRIYAILGSCLRTVEISRTASAQKPNLQLTLSILHEMLLFTRTVIKVQQTNLSKESIKNWKHIFDEFASIFYPMEQRLRNVINGICERIEFHGKVAKLRLMNFFDIVLADDQVLELLEVAKYNLCISRLERAAVQAKLVDEESCSQYHKTLVFIYNSMAPRAKGSNEAAARSSAKLVFVAKMLKVMAKPRRTLLNLLRSNEVHEVFERILVKVFEKENEASQMLNIFAYNFHTFRHLRLLNNHTISEKLWTPVLDAAVFEFVAVVAAMPEGTRELIEPFSRLFSLGVAQIHRLRKDDVSTVKWLDFLMQDEAIHIIQEVDTKLMSALNNFFKDLKKMMSILPYYSSIDEDILGWIDEVEIETILKEATEALIDEDRFAQYVEKKCSLAVSRFIDYLPKMSIPIDRRDIGEGWVLTCRGENGDDLRLSDVSVEKENLICMVLGSGNILSPVMEHIHEMKSMDSNSFACNKKTIDANENGDIEVSVLDHVSELIRNAQQHGYWEKKDDGVHMHNATNLDCFRGLPLTPVLESAIELWQDLEIDDDELLEIAIRDISYQIEQHKEAKHVDNNVRTSTKSNTNDHAFYAESSDQNDVLNTSTTTLVNFLTTDKKILWKHRFNPKRDPTVLYLEIKKLKCCLDNFLYRIQPEKNISIFDPIFEGYGSLRIHNLSIMLRIECRKERIERLGEEWTVPILQLQELEVYLEKVNFQFKDSGADWLLNKVVTGFKTQITKLVEVNLKEEIVSQFHQSLKVLNSYIEVNPEIFLNVLGITLDDLEENVVYV